MLNVFSSVLLIWIPLSPFETSRIATLSPSPVNETWIFFEEFRAPSPYNAKYARNTAKYARNITKYVEDMKMKKYVENMKEYPLLHRLWSLLQTMKLEKIPSFPLYLGSGTKKNSYLWTPGHVGNPQVQPLPPPTLFNLVRHIEEQINWGKFRALLPLRIYVVGEATS